MKRNDQDKPSVILIGGGAAGLCTAMALLDEGWSGKQLTIVEPEAKTEDDRTWSYWAKNSLLPDSISQETFTRLEISSDGESQSYNLGSYRYYSLKSSQFYSYAKEVLAKADVEWLNEFASELLEKEDGVEVRLSNGKSICADYVLDSRLPNIEVPSKRYNATLQHFGGWFVKMPNEVFDVDEVVLMDFIDLDQGVAFFYVIPTSKKEALVEIAVFSEVIWEQEEYDKRIGDYIQKRYKAAPIEVFRKEYGIIPMTDEPLWKTSTQRIWSIGTRGGWVQPSSGYAFTRIARFATEVAKCLSQSRPMPWKPSMVQQVFNSVMLGYIIDKPEKAGSIFYNLFAHNGPERTFDFLDEAASFSQTVRLMWTCPQLPFAKRAVKEIIDRVNGTK